MEAKILESYNDAILQEAMHRYGIGEGEIELLDGFESFVYRFWQAGEQRILRVTHSLHRDEAAIRGEVDWLDYLAAHGVSVAYALMSRSGELVEVLGTGAEYFSASAYIYAPGKPPIRADWQAGLAVALGQMLGQMNRLARGYTPRDTRAHRPTLLQDLDGFERFLPPGEEAVVEKFHQIITGLRSLPDGPVHFGMVHQDAHGGNLHVLDGRITLFDFDDCLYAWYAYDLAMALFYLLPHDCRSREDVELARRRYSELLEGYHRENSLGDTMLAQIPGFLKLREIDLYIAIHRSMDVNNLDPWCASFMRDRREKILQDVPYVDMAFG